MKLKSRKIALTVAGSDSGGGAGIQADLKTFASFGVHGVCAITCLTAQNPKEIRAVHPVPPDFLAKQLEALFGELKPQSLKSGMLYSQGLIETLADFLDGLKNPPPLVLDPVMVSSSGHPLLKSAAIKSLTHKLFPHAALVTPNLDEMKALLGREATDIEGLRSAAKELFETFGTPALMKGGHFRSAKEAVDVFFDGKEEWLLVSPFIPGVSTHGTGCAYSAAIAAGLANGMALSKCVTAAKEFITAAIGQSYKAGTHFVLNHQAKL